ncbi:MAG: hypothetical protein WC222_02710 [Parachlamydiales bacterium]|jgi:hypothetical protein
MIKYLFIALIIPTLIFASSPFRYHSPKLTSAIQSITKLAEAKTLIDKANAQGMVAVETSTQETASFHGMWIGKTRTIYINPHHRSLGGIIQTLIFELHNAAADAQFAALWHDARCGRIDKNTFVEKAERIEFDNLKQAQAILDKGIERQFFPKDCRLQFLPEFKLYYYFQQLAGHSDWFSKQYDNSCPPHMRTPYKGTVYDLTKISVEDRDDLVRYISLCSRLCSGDNVKDAKALESIYRERNTLQNCLKGTPPLNTNCYRAAQRYKLFQEVFGNIL